MPAISTPSCRAFSSGFALVLCAACATYVDEPPIPGSLGLTSGGSAGDGGSDAAGSQGMEPTAGSGGSLAAAGVSGMASAGDGSLGGGGSSAGGAMGGAGAGGVGGKASGGMGGTAGAGGAAGAGGKASGGSGGGAGAGAVQPCSAHAIPNKSSWKLSASHSTANNADPVTNAHDGVLTNRWSTGKDQSGNEWLQIDFGVEVGLTKLTLMLDSSVNDYPRMYQTRISNTAMNTAAQPLLSGSGMASTDTVMSFPKGTRGRYVLISQTGSVTALWWSVAEIQTECAD